MDKSLLILRVKLNCGTVRIMNNKEITKPSQSKIIEEIIPGSDKEREREERSKEREKKRDRPSILTPELRSRLFKLFEEYFFIGVVAVKVRIGRPSIYEWGTFSQK